MYALHVLKLFLCLHLQVKRWGSPHNTSWTPRPDGGRGSLVLLLSLQTENQLTTSRLQPAVSRLPVRALVNAMQAYSPARFAFIHLPLWSARCESVSRWYGPSRYWRAASGDDGGQHSELLLRAWCSPVGLITHQLGRLALWYCQNTRGKWKLIWYVLSSQIMIFSCFPDFSSLTNSFSWKQHFHE